METIDPIDPIDDLEDVKVDDNVDELFEQKMKKLRELGLYDDRMMDKVNLIKEMDANPSKKVPKGQLKRGYVPLGRCDVRQEDLLEFKGDDDNQIADDDAETPGFKPINSGLKWSLPIFKRQKKCDSPNEDGPSSSHQRSDVKGDKKVSVSSDNNKQTKFNNFFESRKKQTQPEETKKDTITDIEAFIRDCNKKAEKPKPLILDDIDDFLAKYTKKLDEISAHFNRK